MLWRFLISIGIKLLIDLPMMIIGMVAFPLAYMQSITSTDQNGNLIVHFPKWAWSWDNQDHGIDGQSFYAKKTPGYPYWLRCFLWSCCRNACFNFSKYGFLSRSVPSPTYFYGDGRIGDKTGPGQYFTHGMKLLDPWEFYYIKPWTLFGRRMCIRIRWGWKIYNKAIGSEAQHCFVAWPFMTYSGV